MRVDLKVTSVRLFAVGLLLAAFATSVAPDVVARTPAPQTSSGAAAGDSVKSWYEPTDPFHIVGPIYYVGTRGLSVFLITTSAGNILLGGAMPGTAPLIEASIRKLGFKPEDIRILLLNHAHIDHAGTLADFKALTGAQLEVMQDDAELLKSGGKTDYLYAKNAKFHFPPVTTDRVLKDGETVSLGDVRLTAHRTPGHTRGPSVGRSQGLPQLCRAGEDQVRGRCRQGEISTGTNPQGCARLRSIHAVPAGGQGTIAVRRRAGTTD